LSIIYITRAPYASILQLLANSIIFIFFILFNSGNMAHRTYTHVDKQTRN